MASDPKKFDAAYKGWQAGRRGDVIGDVVGRLKAMMLENGMTMTAAMRSLFAHKEVYAAWIEAQTADPSRAAHCLNVAWQEARAVRGLNNA